MSYRALLFCPDEKTARVVTQVLSELEFQVEPCNEPFAAVKKLVAEHFDALVVDCENEQNATLLFKSARNSGSNQTSLAVAVVEGQSGVAKAFRIGANLVLTKPINVEQSKGTLRVARGLLRKGEATKPIAKPLPEQPVSSFSSTDTLASSVPQAHFSKPASLTTPAPPLAAPGAPVASSAFELEKEPSPKPEPAEAALLESMPEPQAPVAAKQYPWQPTSKPMAEPMATALKRAAEAAGKAGFPVSGDTMPSEARVSSGSTSQSLSGNPRSAQGAAAAAAPAKVVPLADGEAVTSQVEPPTFSSSIGEPPAESTGSKKIWLIAAIILIAAAAGYYGWTKMGASVFSSFLHKTAPAPAQIQSPQAVSPSAMPVQGLAGASTPAGANAAATLPRAPEKASVTPEMAPAASKKSPSTPASTDEGDTGVVKTIEEGSESDAIVVKSEAPRPAIHHPAPAEAVEPSAPETLDIASNSTNQAIAGLVSMPARVPTATPQTVKLSQGVSQGLLIKKVPPEYPPQARQMRLQGAVQLMATISKEGNIENLKVLSGDSVLARAAINAVKQWKYKPYLLDSQPVEIQTQITVNFKLP